MTAVMAKGDGFSQRDIESEWAGNRGGHLSDFDGMREARSLVIIGEYEYLCFACQSAKGRSMQNTIAIAFKTCAKWIGLFGNGPIASSK
jgi:hypothetical protein